MIQAERILLRSVVTEKATELTSHNNAYTFKVHADANKVSVAQAVAKTFDVEVANVNILNIKPKVKRSRMRRGSAGIKSGYKKAIVTLKPGQTIDLV